jgi:type II secretory pathway pseudopilin PulG
VNCVKKSLTILEVMVVIFIIGIVMSVVGVNMKGSMEETKAFKSETGSRQIYEILSLELAKDSDVARKIGQGASEIRTILNNSGLVKDVNKILEDGWGRPYTVTCVGDDIKVTSEAYLEFLSKKKKMKPSQIQSKCPWMESEKKT